MSTEPPVAIVTGASRGIGKCCAIHLARCGFDVTVCARTASPGVVRALAHAPPVRHHAAPRQPGGDRPGGTGRGTRRAGRPPRPQRAGGRRERWCAHPRRVRACRRRGEQRGVHGSRRHGPLPRHAARALPGDAPVQRAGAAATEPAGRTVDDRAGRRPHHQHHGHGGVRGNRRGHRRGWLGPRVLDQQGGVPPHGGGAGQGATHARHRGGQRGTGPHRDRALRRGVRQVRDPGLGRGAARRVGPHRRPPRHLPASPLLLGHDGVRLPVRRRTRPRRRRRAARRGTAQRAGVCRSSRPGRRPEPSHPGSRGAGHRRAGSLPDLTAAAATRRGSPRSS